jgi:hypothetical protein
MNRALLKAIYLKYNVQTIERSQVLELKKHLDYNGVICIKNQNLTPHEMKKFISKFGKIVRLPSSL